MEKRSGEKDGIFSCHTRLKVFDSSRTRSWQDLWRGNKVLKEAFSKMYGIAHVVKASNCWFIRVCKWLPLVECLFFQSGSWWGGWYFLKIFSSCTLLDCLGGVDTIFWESSMKGKFSVRSFCTALIPKDCSRFPWKKSIWLTVTPLRAIFFIYFFLGQPHWWRYWPCIDYRILISL